jgi:nicotinate phosphoribosyltransferase
MLLNIAVLKNLHLTAPEREYLHQTCPYFQPAYLDYLEKLRLHPDEQVTVDFVLKQRAKRSSAGNHHEEKDGGNDQDESGEDLGLIELGVKGLWRECILYEVPLMAIRKSTPSHSLSSLSSESATRY